MALTVAERKHRLSFGAQESVAKKLGEDKWFVSRVVNDKAVNYNAARVRRCQVELARRMKVRWAVAFGDEPLDEGRPAETEPSLAEVA